MKTKNETVTIPQNEYNELKLKAAGYDEIEKKVMAIYEDFDDEGNEIPAEEEGDLATIGEFVCTHFGMM